MEICEDYKMPHSKFLAWDELDQAKVLAHKIEKASRCPGCGTAEWEWEQDRTAYIPIERICRGCEIKELINTDTEHHAGKYVTLEPRK